MNNRFMKKTLIILLCMIVVACVTENAGVKKLSRNIQWPALPAKARVSYVQSFSTPEDIGIRKGFWQRVGEFFTGVEETQMLRPMAITTTNGKIYVTDPGIKGLHRFDRDNNEYSVIRLSGNTPMISPISVINDGEGGVIFSDSGLRKLFKVKADSDVAVEIDLSVEFKQPTGLAISSKGDLYVVDTLQHKVFKFNAAGELDNIIGKRGTNNGEFNFPTMISINKNNEVLVTDSLNFRVQVFSSHGVFKQQISQLGNASGYQLRPKGVATDKQGNVYIVDSLFHNLQIFNQQGQYLLSVGERGQALGQFWLPTGVHIDQQQTVYVADSYNHRIQMFKTQVVQ